MQSWSAVSQLRGTAFPRKHPRHLTTAHARTRTRPAAQAQRPLLSSRPPARLQLLQLPAPVTSVSAPPDPGVLDYPNPSLQRAVRCSPPSPVALALRSLCEPTQPTALPSAVPQRRRRLSNALSSAALRSCHARVLAPTPTQKCPVQRAACSVPVSRPSHRVSGPSKSHTASFQQYGQRVSVAISLQTCSRGPVECPLDYMDPSSVLPPYCSTPAHRIERAPSIP